MSQKAFELNQRSGNGPFLTVEESKKFEKWKSERKK